MDKKNIFDVFDKLKQIKADKHRAIKQFSLRRGTKQRIDDLIKEFHQVGKVKLPYPTLFSQDQIEKYFGGLQHIDLNNLKDLAAVVFFLKNNKSAEISTLPRKELDEEIHKIMTDIPLRQRDEYVYCVTEIFEAIKKKSLRYQHQIYQNILNMLGATGEV